MGGGKQTLMQQESDSLRLGKGAAFVKSHLKRLRQEDESWEADFRALPKPMTQTVTHYLGLVVTQPDVFLLGDTQIELTVRSCSRALFGIRARRFHTGQVAY